MHELVITQGIVEMIVERTDSARVSPRARTSQPSTRTCSVPRTWCWSTRWTCYWTALPQVRPRIPVGVMDVSEGGLEPPRPLKGTSTSS